MPNSGESGEIDSQPDLKLKRIQLDVPASEAAAVDDDSRLDEFLKGLGDS